MNTHVRGFLLDRSSRGFTKKTLSWYEQSLDTFYNWLENESRSTNPETWDALLLREYISFLQTTLSVRGKPYSGNTVTTRVQSLITYCRWLFEEELIDKDITKRVKKPRPPQEQKEPFTETECKLLIQAASMTTHSLRDQAIVLVLLDCGLRASELCNLRVADVLLDQNLLRIRQGKGKKDRVTPCSVQTSKAISRYLLKGRTSLTSLDNLFLSEREGNDMTASGLRQLLLRLGKTSGVKNVYTHRFRHTFALMFLRNQGDSLVLQKLLGHSTLDMTKRYVNMMTQDLVDAHERSSPVSNLK